MNCLRDQNFIKKCFPQERFCEHSFKIDCSFKIRLCSSITVKKKIHETVHDFLEIFLLEQSLSKWTGYLCLEAV